MICGTKKVPVCSMLVGMLLGANLLAWDTPSEGQVLPHQGKHATQEEAVQKLSGPETSPPGVPSEQPGQAEVTVDNGTLSVSLKEANFREVMEAIAKQSGVHIRFFGEGSQTPLTDAFAGLPLEDGLLRLLRERNYVMAHVGAEQERRIAQVYVLPHRGGRPEDFDEATIATLGERIQQSFDSEEFGEAVKAAIAAGQRTIIPDLLSPDLQRLLSGTASAD